MFYVVALGKGHHGWGSLPLGKRFASIEEAVEVVNKKESDIDYALYYSIFIVDDDGEVVAINNCLGWQYK